MPKNEKNVVRYEVKEKGPFDGVSSLTFPSWIDFIVFGVKEQMFVSDYVYRGQKNATWELYSSLDRRTEEIRKTWTEYRPRIEIVLNNFKQAARGRRGPNPQVLSDNDWWALGRHYGLETPLLDWTRSLFIAAFFAFEDELGATKDRVIYGLDRQMVEKKNARLDPKERIEFVDPSVDDNARLISQAGIFTKIPEGVNIEGWVRKYFKGVNKEIVLLKMFIPTADGSLKYFLKDSGMIHPALTDRKCFLRALSRMNITHLTLFPDLAGAARHCVAAHEIEGI